MDASHTEVSDSAPNRDQKNALFLTACADVTELDKPLVLASSKRESPFHSEQYNGVLYNDGLANSISQVESRLHLIQYPPFYPVPLSTLEDVYRLRANPSRSPSSQRWFRGAICWAEL